MNFNSLFDYFFGEPFAFIILILFFTYLSSFIEYYFGSKSIKNLNDFPAIKSTDDAIPVSIIIPARNEELKIREALTSILNLDYPNYEVIVINDRSEDNTGYILNEMSNIDKKLKVVNIDSLPSGWLGKNYVLNYGANNANGEYLLFTDADVIYEPDTLSRVIPYVIENNIDHLSMAPRQIFHGILLTAVICIFEFLFVMKFKPWKVSNPKSKAFIGIGSFNMISTSAYKETGGFETLKMRPDDDIMLGKLVKKFGFSSAFLYASEHLSIEWYYSVGEMIKAFYKNTYSGFNYNIFNALSSIIFFAILSILPFISLFILDEPGLLIDLGVLLIIFFIYLILTAANKISIFYCFTYPLACCIIVYLMLRSISLTILNGGIKWRGTFYPLKDLKENKV